MPPAFSWPVWTSLLANIALFSVKLACFLRARSLAVAASLLDSTLDLLAQCLLAVAAALGERPDPRFPVGARRLEAAAVIVVAAVFAVGAAEVATECVSRLARGASAPVPELKNTDLALLSGVVAAKLALFAACDAFMKAERRSQRLVSPSIKALAADHAADALTNGVALLAAFGASGATFGKKGERNRNRRSTLSRLADPLGGLVIAVAVFFGWGVQAWDHVSKLVGKRASREVLEKIRDKVEERRRALVSSAGPPVRRSGDDALGETETESSETLLRHRRDEKTNENENGFVFELDSIRAYHGGERVVVEAEVVMCPETTLRESHDACLLLQQDLESMEEVERAFVHADYAKRFTPEHVWDAARLLNPVLNSRNRNVPNDEDTTRRGLLSWFFRGRRAARASASGDFSVREDTASDVAERHRRHRRLGSNVDLTCEDGEGPAFDTIATPMLPER
jgi:divalent metal cation (Fe/Co/Zn/Cd) transporter